MRNEFGRSATMDPRSSIKTGADMHAAGRYGGYSDRSDHTSSMPTARSSEKTDLSSNRSNEQTSQPRGILKSSAPAPARDSAHTQLQDPLAQRFYRVSKPEPRQQVPGFPQFSYLPDENYHSVSSFVTENDSTSELSTITQATSVALDVPVSPTKLTTSSRAPAQIKNVRHVPPPPATRVKMPRRTIAPYEVQKNSVAQSNGRRTVQIQVLPSEKETIKDLQLARNVERSLLRRIQDLESETQSLQDSRSRLSKDLDDASERLSVKELGNREVEIALKKEKTSKELILRDLEEQRRLFDELRRSFELQHCTLVAVEEERDNFKRTKDKLEMQLISFETSRGSQISITKGQEEYLERQIVAFERAAQALEQRVGDRDREVKSLTSERDALKSETEQYQATLNALSDAQAALKEQKVILEEDKKQLQVRVEEVDGAKVALAMAFENEKASLLEDFGKEKTSLLKTFDDEKNTLQRGFEEEKSNLQASINGLGEEIVSLKDQIAALELAKEALEKQRVDETTEQQAKIDSLMSNLEGAKDANVYLASEKLALEAKLSETNSNVTTAQAQVDEIQQHNQSLQSDLDANVYLAFAKLALEKELSEMKGDLTNAKAEIDRLEGANKTMQSDVEERMKGLEELRDQHKALEDRVQVLQAEIDKYSGDQLVILNKELEESNEKLEKEKTELEEASTKLNQEKAELEESKKILQAEAEKVPTLMEQTQVLSSKIDSISLELMKAKADFNSSTAYSRELQAQVHQLQNLSKSHAGCESRPGRHTRTRSSSLMFVRSPTDRSGTVFVAKRNVPSRETSASRGRKE